MTAFVNSKSSVNSLIIKLAFVDRMVLHTFHNPYYSPKFVFGFIRDISSDCHKTGSKYNSEDMIKATIAELIDQVGITHGMDGRLYLIDAIFHAIKTDAKTLTQIYPILAGRYGKSEQSIEKAIRTAINKAWKNTDINVLRKYYTPQTSFISGSPSNKEFIFFFADKIKA